MMGAKHLKINLVLFLIAAAVATYLVWHHYTLANGQGGFSSFCSINAVIDCDAVNASTYSEILGIPIADIALGYYVFAIILCIIGLANVYTRRDVLVVLLPFTLLSAVASFGTLSIMMFQLHKWCFMCSGLQLADLLTCIVTLLGVRSVGPSKPNRKRLIGFAVLGAVVVGGTVLGAEQLRVPIPFDAEQFVNDYRAQPVVNVEPGDSPRQGFVGDAPPVRIIEFADFQCPACGMAARLMHRLLLEYGNRVQLIFKFYPLDSSCNPNIKYPMHPFGCTAARSAYCAKTQGKFVAYYEKLFGNQHEISPENIKSWAQELGLDMAAFDACVASNDSLNAVLKDVDQAGAVNLQSTPTFIVAGRKVEGAIDEQRLKALLRELGK